MATDFVLTVVKTLAEYSVAPVLRQCGYLIFYKRNVQDLTEKVKTLASKRDGVQLRVDGANRNLETILPDVLDWLDRVNKTIQEKETRFHEERVEKATTCCCSNSWCPKLNRWCPNLKVRRSLSREATKMVPKLDKLIEEGNFSIISCPAPPRMPDYQVIQYPKKVTHAAVKPHEGASSSPSNIAKPPAPMDLSERLPYTKDLLTALQDDKISMIGISGTFREIDTVPTKEFIKRMKHRNLFKEVGVVVVSQDPDLKRIQDDIADMLMLKLENGSLVERAEKLRAASISKRVLVILADVCGIPDLEAIGISHVDIKKSCKIMLISKQSNVFGEMETRSSFKLLIDSTPMGRPIEFESRSPVIRSVMDALTDDESNPIVICGMGGIGKTTLVKEIGAKAGEVDLFDEIAVAEFTEEHDLIKIQGKLANDLGLELKEHDDMAAKLRERLSGGAKQKLVILDNVWKTQLDLWTLGIPISSDPKICKVLVTSRERDIFKDMKTKRNFPIEGLPLPDAWDLFKKMTGGHIESEGELCDIAKQVLNECGGLPVAISAVGKALIGGKIEAWRRALRQLQQPYPKDVPTVIEDVYGKIKFSYECLKDDSLKKFFLVWSILEDNGFMPDLIKYGIGLGRGVAIGFGLGVGLGTGIFDGVETGRDDIEVFTGILRDRSLLLEGDGNEGVRMHDVVRHVALHIGSIELKLKKNDPSENRAVFKQRHSSLTTCIRTTEFLVLGSKSVHMKNELEQSATVFHGMEDLKVLMTWNLIFPSLPLSKDLRTLLLVDCRLEFDVDVIGELWKLMVLDLSGSDISQLPETFKNLSNLRLLNLSRCRNLKVISPGVISSLYRLEEFYMDVFDVWVVEKLGSTATTNWISQMEVDADSEEVKKWKRLNRLALEKLGSTETTTERSSEPEKVNLFAVCASNIQFTSWASSMNWSVGLLSELLSLSCLTALEVILPPVKNLLSSKLFHKLKRFNIGIGWQECTWQRLGNNLRICDLAATYLVGTGISVVLEKTERLQLMMKNLTDPLNVLDVDGCANLESFQLQNCDSLQYLIDMTLEEHTPRRSSIFPVLNYLKIMDSKNLKAIFHGDLPPGSLQKLKTLRLFDLPALTTLWSIEHQSVSLGDLAQIFIKGCHSLEAIFSLEGSGLHVKEINFPRLTQLRLEFLPSFTGMSKSSGKGQQEHSLFSDPKVVFPVLTVLIIFSLENLNHIWTSEHSPTSFSELIRLQVDGCHRLLQLVPTQMQNSLQKLDSIEVINCSSLQVLFEDRSFTANERNASVSQTNNISHADQGMQINDIMDFKQSWHGFQNLTNIEVKSCGNLINLFSPSIARGLLKLKSLVISQCHAMETIVAAGECKETENESLLPHLEKVRLYDLPNLRSFCEGKSNFHWPLVKQIAIDNCDKLNKFCSGSLSISSNVYLRGNCGGNLMQELNDSRKES